MERKRFKRKKRYAIAQSIEAQIRGQVVDEILTILDADAVISTYPAYVNTYRDQIDDKRNTP